jgi:ribonuclease P protein subunit POP4
MRARLEVVRNGFIGTEAKVAKSRHRNYVGACGRIVDETRNTFTLVEGEKKRIIVKESAVFHFRFSDDTVVEIDGRLLTGRPEDRLKKNVRRLW